jgi:hypothetical protein
MTISLKNVCRLLYFTLLCSLPLLLLSCAYCLLPVYVRLYLVSVHVLFVPVLGWDGTIFCHLPFLLLFLKKCGSLNRQEKKTLYSAYDTIGSASPLTNPRSHPLLAVSLYLCNDHIDNRMESFARSNNPQLWLC